MDYVRRSAIIASLILIALIPTPAVKADADDGVFRLGMIGLDTSHVIAFMKLINSGEYPGFRVVAGYPGGSPDIESSASRVEGYTAQLRDDYGLTIVHTIEELCGMVDGVLLESVDGRPHLAQVRPVIAAGKPVFIDKPMAGDLEDVIEIFRLADEAGVPCWSSSSLRFCEGIASMPDDPSIGRVTGCDAFSPAHLEPHHPDLYWYGIHGVEILFTIMGPGCDTVRRVRTDGTELVVGVWKDGRIGTFRGIRDGKGDYGAFVYGTAGIAPSGRYSGYKGLVDEIIAFFRTGDIPVPREETLEIYAFMTAADISKQRGGEAVSISSVLDMARR